MNAGIDYGLGRANIDPATRIRYGVISQHSLAHWFYDDWEAEYGDPRCLQCGNAVQEVQEGDDYGEDYDRAPHESADYVCHACQFVCGSESAFPDEPIGYSLNDPAYDAASCLDSDVMITRSPYYTYAAFCSPCVPGAGNLDDARDSETGIRAYCLGHEYFEDHKAPYRVFRVADDSEVLP